MSIREEKGRQIADRYRITRKGNLWLVPSQSGRGKYTVDADAQRCSCPDFDFRRQPCKHIFAVQTTVEREQTTVTETAADGSTKTTVTETVKVTRKTYKQEWPAYNAAQTQEKRLFLYLLHQLCQGVGSPAQHGRGQRRLPLEDMIFAMAFKVYSTVSGRRFMTDMRDAHAKGYTSKLPCYNSIFNYFESEVLTEYLLMLIEESSLPLRAIEEDFAVDSSGISTGVYQKWSEAKWGGVRMLFGEMQPNEVNRKDWLKLHICTGVKTNVVTAVKVTDCHAGDSPEFPALVETTAQNFAMRQVSADRAYLSNKNLKVVAENYAVPYIPFKTSSTGKDKHNSDLFKRMYHFYSYNQERFMQSYHKRSNVESTFHMIKAKFGNLLRSKTRTAQINEALCKVLCHNICCLIQSMFELGLKPKFWAEAA
jgi:predicted nucleic acid-binding Zn finger protein